MSVRPREVADEASRFTLRNFFTSGTPTEDATGVAADGPTARGSKPSSAHVQQQQQQRQQQQPQLLHQGFAAPVGYAAAQQQQQQQPQQQQLRFDLAGAGGVGPPLLPLATGSAGAAAGLKFTLPSMRAADGQAASIGARGGGGGIEKKLQAGYITGGFSKTNDPEIMRLNGVIDDLQSKLRKSSERIATAEQSVARGNAALQSERATSHARIVALASEVKKSQHREANVRAELAAVPKLEDFDQAKFEMQARGAVELQANYDEEVNRAHALEEVIKGINDKHEALLLEHTSLQARLDEATADLERAREGELAAIAASTAASTAATTAAAAAAPAAPAAPLPVRAEIYVPPEEAGITVPCTPGTISLDEHERAIDALHQALRDAHARVAMQEQVTTAERLRNAEADELIKELDNKLANVREDARRHVGAAAAATGECGDRSYLVQNADAEKEEEDDSQKTAKWALLERNLSMDARESSSEASAALPQRQRVVAEFQRYFTLKQKAEHAATVVECAGASASQAMIDTATHAHACARRAYWCMINDEPERPLVGCCVTTSVADDEEPEIDVLAIRTDLATSMNANGFQMGVGCVGQEDCSVDLHCVSAATGRVTMSHTSEAVGLKMRTDKYVSAVSGDIKAKLLAQRNAWNKTQLGQAVPTGAFA